MPNNFEAAIFDMDGLIVDSEPLNSLSWEMVLGVYNKKPIYDKGGLIHTVGVAGDAGYKEIIEKYDLQEDIKILRKKRRDFFVEIIRKTKITPLPGFLELIRLLKKENLKIALASNRVLRHVLLILEKIDVKEFFDVMIGPSPDRKHKPAPDIYLQTAKKLRVLPEKCVVMEDSESGVIAAKRAGMRVIAVPNKYTQTHDFSIADKIVESLRNINLQLLHEL